MLRQLFRLTAQPNLFFVQKLSSLTEYRNSFSLGLIIPPSNLEFVMEFGRKPGWPSRVMGRRALVRRTAADVADEILEFLENGRLRDVEEVADAVDLPEKEVEKILDILTRTGFIRKGVQITHLGSNFTRLPVEKLRSRL